jgi:NTE family protein
MDRLDAFWSEVEQKGLVESPFDVFGLSSLLGTMNTVMRGIPSFFTPNLAALRGTKASVGVEAASYYSTEPLRQTLEELIDWQYLCDCKDPPDRRRGQRVHWPDALLRHPQRAPRRRARDGLRRAAAGFGAIRIDGHRTGDGGIYSNTPIEAVLDDSRGATR